MSFDIQQLTVTTDDKTIVQDFSLSVPAGEVHVLMGPNGCGKSTLANAVMGHPGYHISEGSVLLDGTDITTLPVNEKARAGLFLSMQYLPAIDGVSVTHFLRTASQALTGQRQNPVAFLRSLKASMRELGIDESFAQRDLHVGFSGGEKKKLEILQLLTLAPKYAILDETDSGLDVDALRIVAEGIEKYRSTNTGVLLITHYNRILEYVQPDRIHVMKAGRRTHSGGPELAAEIESRGYAHIA